MTRITVLYMETAVCSWHYLAKFFVAWETFQIKFAKKIIIYFTFKLFSKNRAVHWSGKIWYRSSKRPTFPATPTGSGVPISVHFPTTPYEVDQSACNSQTRYDVDQSACTSPNMWRLETWLIRADTGSAPGSQDAKMVNELVTLESWDLHKWRYM
jgi:hypothetical protein